MIKKLIGIIVATAVIVIIVIAAVRRNNFQSMVLRDEIEDQTYPEPVACQTQNIPFFTTGHRRNRGSRGDFPGTKIRNMSVFMPKMTMVSLFLRKKLHKFAQPT